MRRSATGRLRLAAVLTVASLGLLACGSDNGTETAEPAASSSAGGAESDVRVGLAYDVGGRGDRSFNDSAYAGASAAARD